MDFEQNNNQKGPTQDKAINEPTSKPEKTGTGWRIFLGIVLALSILVNILLVFMLIAVIAVFAAGPRDTLAEEFIQTGPRRNKIVIIKLEGIIDGLQAENIQKQLKRARKDRRVKGLIISVNSPGGTISGSDQIYNEIRKYRNESGIPVVAFMQGMAASGGYYASVACDKIMAEQTTITGSIGVIFGHFVLQQLLEEKLGVEPVMIASGAKKTWLSMFKPFEEEQRQYVQDRLINPAYERFVEVVDEGRPTLDVNEVKEVADGGIYSAKEALKEELIDDIGYLDDAIDLVKSLAGIDKAQVVEYRRPFSLAGFLSLQNKKNILQFDRAMLYELSTPQLLYLWTGY
ncbi:MAG: signal peptide peptidase SppA [Phycisphaerae bacterium]|nr:signal peptide peptidase SppA [Phycisphaerae bacterium]NIP51739.1 signal peptide peptidase SppA [Phycisphaerae bacterium]NIS54371.1 signal peptide peptidase SppA [Phycisphaerae bacterium]NIU12003.1 signal peptide peptidase SppA [Phycisphaerae bacterium]NIU59848.1 signal peptide peptidase SppA [Phycisphaerae bacterium]